jgi:Carboxypeptidase regulatory-like domain
MSRLWILFFVVTLFAVSVWAQSPTGAISGTVTDESGAVVPNAKVTITNKSTGAARDLQSGADGAFAAASLAAGQYEVRAEAPGFRVLLRPTTVETGSTTTVNMAMLVGKNVDVVTVEAAAATMNYESNTVQGVVTTQQIDSLPLNGRSFLNLAQLEPGVLVTPANPAQFNAQFSVSVLGGPASRTSMTVDGGNVRNPVEGGSGTNFSQEVVQEFQLSSTNFDLSTGITAFGAINVVTRSGSNSFHGAGYFYFRDHHTAAYPSLNRNPITDDLFFARRQPGVWVGGPIKKDRLFFFANYEYTSQAGVYVVTPDLPSLAAFQSLGPAPYHGKTLSAKFDYRLSDKTTLFLRYSHDGNNNSGPFGIAVPQSNFVTNANWSDQTLLGITTVITPTVVNDIRFSYWYWQNRNVPYDCGGCLGAGGPETFVNGSNNFVLGNNFNSPQGRDLRRYPLSDNLSWQVGSHRIKFGGEWEFDRGTGYWGFFDPARVYVLPPETLNAIGIPPALFGLGNTLTSAADIYKLPVAAFILGIGDRAQPSYNLANARGNNRLHFYAQDTWKVTPKFTLNYGLGWEYESNVLNYDLSRPALLSPLLGGNLNPPSHQYRNFTPAVGFAWTPRTNAKTVIRGGFGIFFDTQEGWWRLGERAVLGGSGRQFIGNAAVVNPFPGIPGVPVGSTFNNFLIPYGTFLQLLPTLIAEENAIFPGNGNTPQINTSKQANALGAIYPHDFPTTQSQHFNIGLQHELGGGIVVTADFVYRHTIHATPGGFFGASVDFNRYYSVGGPVIPACVASQINSPTAQCSNGPIDFWWPGATASYKALLLKVDKRFAKRYQFTGSYAYQRSESIGDITQDLNNYNNTYGPDQPRHVLNISGSVDLPWGFQMSILSAFISPEPVEPVINGVDSTGTNTQSSAYSLLPGAQYNTITSQSQLAKLVANYNATYAGTLTPAGAAGISRGQTYPTITLPSHYNLGHDFTSQDIRISKVFKIHEKYQFKIIAEAFNIFNFGNLTGDSFNLTSPSSFGQPTQRVSSTFGSGGPRAFQFAGRFQF